MAVAGTMGSVWRKLAVCLMTLVAVALGAEGVMAQSNVAGGNQGVASTQPKIQAIKNETTTFKTEQLNSINTRVTGLEGLSTTITQDIVRVQALLNGFTPPPENDPYVLGALRTTGNATQCGTLSCADNQKLSWDGSRWRCLSAVLPVCVAGAQFNASTCACTTVCPAGQSADSNGACCASANISGGVCQQSLTCAATSLAGCSLPSHSLFANQATLISGSCATGMEPANGAANCNATCRADSATAAYTSPNIGCVASGCAAGTEMVNNSCVPVCPSGQTRNAQGACVISSCPAGQDLVNGQCVAACGSNQVRDAQGVCTCATGTEMVNGQCVAACGSNQVRDAQGVCACATGTEMVNGQCVTTCGSNQVRNTQGACVCNTNYEMFNGQCVAVCTDNKVRNAAGACVCQQGWDEWNGKCYTPCTEFMTPGPSGGMAACTCPTNAPAALSWSIPWVSCGSSRTTVNCCTQYVCQQQGARITCNR